ncbi:MAG: GTP-binding protein [Clostridia bacterium]|nr:GTP-binding protein [Clostridia bacterium]
MTKIDIFSGFLGAGKTTLIKKLIAESYQGEKLVLIENEFGEIGIDGGFLQEAGIEITEMNSGCICCSLVGDFGEALKKVLSQYAPDRILIEPSGVGKLSDVIKAVRGIDSGDIVLNAFTTVVDAGKCKMYMKNFGEFFNNQVEHAGTIIMSHADAVGEDKLKAAVELVREKNPTAVIVSTPISMLDGAALLEAIERKDTLNAAIEHLLHEQDDEEDEHEHHHQHHDDDEDEHEHHHHHHDDDEDEHEHHHHHHDYDEDEHEHHHHHHDDDEDEHEHHHHDDDEHEHHHHDDEDEHEHHHHDHGPDCTCGCHDHDHEHHHHHHADDVFTSWGLETTKRFSKEELESVLSSFADAERFGTVLRAKGIVDGVDGAWIHFDYVPGEVDVRNGGAGIIGRLCVIGSELKEDQIKAAFGA